jgi:hypothetical protein
VRRIRFKVVQPELFSDDEVSAIEHRSIQGEDGKNLVVISIRSDDIDEVTLHRLSEKFKEQVAKLNKSAQVICLALPAGSGEAVEILEEIEGDPTT